MKKLTYVNPEVEYAIVENDILTGSFDAGADTDVDGMPIKPDEEATRTTYFLRSGLYRSFISSMR